MNVCQSGFKLNASLYVFVFPLLSLSLAQRRVWLGEATKSGAAMAAPAAPAPTALITGWRHVHGHRLPTKKTNVKSSGGSDGSDSS